MTTYSDAGGGYTGGAGMSCGNCDGTGALYDASPCPNCDNSSGKISVPMPGDGGEYLGGKDDSWNQPGLGQSGPGS